jgi:peptidyl-tRNA hydrolase
MEYKKLAGDLMFGKVVVAELEEKYGLTLRKGKTAADISHARAKAVKAGMAKIEFELSMLEVYLKPVLKKVSKK